MSTNQPSLERVKNYIAQKDFYTALQSFKSYYHRIKSHTPNSELTTILCDFTKIFVNENQVQSAIELSRLLLDLIEKNENLDQQVVCEQLLDLSHSMSGSNLLWQGIRTRMLRYVGDCHNTTALSKLEESFAHAFLDADQIYLARAHSKNIIEEKPLVDFLIKYCDKFILKSEIEYFTLQFTLHILSTRNPELATSVFHAFIDSHRSFRNKHQFPYHHPALNFVHLLFQSISTRSIERFEVICRIYKPTWNMDKSNENVISKIREAYFVSRTQEERQPTAQSGTGFGTALNSLLNFVRSNTRVLSSSNTPDSTPNQSSTDQSSHNPNINESYMELD